MIALEGYATLLLFPVLSLLVLVAFWAGTWLIRFVRGLFD